MNQELLDWKFNLVQRQYEAQTPYDGEDELNDEEKVENRLDWEANKADMQRDADIDRQMGL